MTVMGNVGRRPTIGERERKAEREKCSQSTVCTAPDPRKNDYTKAPPPPMALRGRRGGWDI